MSSKIARLKQVLAAGGLLLLAPCAGCGGNPLAPRPTFAPRLAPAPPPGAGRPVVAEPFSLERAWAHLVALSDLGPRPAGSDANREALEYIRTRLEELGLELIEVESGEDPEQEGGESVVRVSHLSARIPGESPDSIMLLAHYDTFDRSPGANQGASGPAVLLELARQLVERPLPYTVEIVFLDGDMGHSEDQPDVPLSEGGQIMARHLAQAGTLDVVRLAVVFGQVGDADLTIARDLHSQRIHREVFFDVAEALGLGDSFPRGRGYVESPASHRALRDAGMPRVVLIHDPWYGGDEVPGEYHGGEHDVRDHCAPQSLHTVGVVTLASLRQIAAQLEKVDRVSGRLERRRAESLARPEVVGEPVEDDDPAPSDEAAAASAPETSSESRTTPAEPTVPPESF